jgi:hypothetical protein
VYFAFQVLLEATEPTLDDIEGVGIVHSRFYLLLSELAQKEADHKGYYRYSFNIMLPLNRHSFYE